MDKAFECFVEAQSYIDSFIDVSVADAFFEAEGEDIAEHNKKAESGAMAALKRGFNSLIETVKKLIERFKKFINDHWLNAEERKRYEEFKQMVKSDPELAKQKVTIADFREYEKLYEEAKRKLEAEANKEEPSDEIAQKIINETEEKIKGLARKVGDVAKRGAIAIGLRTAIDIADRNSSAAKAMVAAMDAEIVDLQGLSNELGEKNVNKAQKKIRKYANAGWFHRWYVEHIKKKELTLRAVFKDQTKQLLSFVDIKKKEDNGEASGAPAKKVKDTIGSVKVSRSSISRGIHNNMDVAASAFGSKKKARDVAKTMAHSSFKKREMERKAKEDKKEFDNLKDFITGGKKKSNSED